MKTSRLILTMLLTISLLISISNAFAADKSVITFAHMNAVGDPIDQTAQKFKELVESKTDKAEVRVFPAAQLGDDEQSLEGMKLGTIQMSMSGPDYLAKLVPEFAVFTLPYMFQDWDHVERAMDGEVGTELNQLLIEKQGLRILVWGHNGFRNMVTKTKKINSMADFTGVPFRSPGLPVSVDMFKAIGATPTPIPWPEVYSAMKQGIVDGMESTPLGFKGTKIYEVAENVIMTNHLYTAMSIMISDKYYQGLPEEVKKAIDESAEEITQWQRDLVIGMSGSVFDLLKEKGMTIIEIDTSELREAVKPVWVKMTADSPKSLEYAEKITALGN